MKDLTQPIGLDDQGLIHGRGNSWFFLYATATRVALGSVKPPNQGVLGPPSPGIKQPGCEADHSPPSSVEDNNVWGCTSTPPDMP